MYVVKFNNSILSSNSYILFDDEYDSVWIIDPGDSIPLKAWMTKQKKTLQGILLTHSHIDHIYGVNELCESFPDLQIYSSEHSLVGLFSAKANGSYHMENPYVVNHDKITIVKDGQIICLFGNKYQACILSTPGHNNDCISFEVEGYLFTGDALIPGVRVYTKSKNGNKLVAWETINRIVQLFSGETIICPGHREMSLLKDISINELGGSNIDRW
jgi:hydroxyacylglutathione hydrolase